jgi:hypothetical protein
MLMPSELPSALEPSGMLRDLFEEADPEGEAKTLWLNRAEVEIDRAFAGEYLFSLFYAYRAFIGRVAYLLMKSYKTGKLQPWHDDATLTSLLRDVLAAEELFLVQRTGATRLRLVQRLIEQKMLTHIAEVVSGTASATFNLDQAQRIIASASQVKSKDGA